MNSTYRLFSAALSLLILVSISLPASFLMNCGDMGLKHAMDHSEITEEASSAGTHDHHTVSTKDELSCDLNIVCECRTDRTQLRTEAPVIQTSKTTGLLSTEVIAEVHDDAIQLPLTPAESSDAFSSPPIFLVNSSFLN